MLGEVYFIFTIEVSLTHHWLCSGRSCCRRWREDVVGGVHSANFGEFAKVLQFIYKKLGINYKGMNVVLLRRRKGGQRKGQKNRSDDPTALCSSANRMDFPAILCHTAVGLCFSNRDLPNRGAGFK